MEVLRANIREREKLLDLCSGFLFFFLFFLFWWLGVEVVVGGGGCGCGCGLSVMSLKSSSHGGFESKYQRKGEASLG